MQTFPSDTTSAVVAQGSVSAVLATFYHDAIEIALPFVLVAFVLIVVDLVFGCAASKARGEDVRFSRAVRRTLDKVVSYTCWVLLAATLAISFDYPPLSKIILAFVMGIELISVVSNYMAMKGKKITGLKEFALKIFGKKLNVDVSDIKIEDDGSEEK